MSRKRITSNSIIATTSCVCMYKYKKPFLQCSDLWRQVFVAGIRSYGICGCVTHLYSRSLFNNR